MRGTTSSRWRSSAAYITPGASLPSLSCQTPDAIVPPRSWVAQPVRRARSSARTLDMTASVRSLGSLALELPLLELSRRQWLAVPIGLDFAQPITHPPRGNLDTRWALVAL